MYWVPTLILCRGPFRWVSFCSSSSNSQLNRMLSMMSFAPTPLTPHTKRIHLRRDYYLKAIIIGCLIPVGLAINRCLWREIILTIRCIKSSCYTQFYSTLAMSGVIHSIIHFHFTLYIWKTVLGHLWILEMINCSLFYWLCVLWWLLWSYFSDIVFGRGICHYLPGISHHLPVIIWLGRGVTFGDSIASNAAPHTTAKLVIIMHSKHMPVRSEYVMFSTLLAIQRLPSHHYFVIDIYYRLLLRSGIVFALV